jgi:hypothetical protein
LKDEILGKRFRNSGGEIGIWKIVGYRKKSGDRKGICTVKCKGNWKR